jgi:hypothetical protein
VQCRIGGEYARTSKDVNGYAFCFRASFGPVGRDEMEFIHAWMGSQQAVTFEESEEQLDYDDSDADVPDLDDAPPATRAKASAPPMFGDDDPAAAAPSAGKKAAADKNREIGHRYPKKSKTTATRGKGKK